MWTCTSFTLTTFPWSVIFFLKKDEIDNNEKVRLIHSYNISLRRHILKKEEDVIDNIWETVPGSLLQHIFGASY